LTIFASSINISKQITKDGLRFRKPLEALIITPHQRPLNWIRHSACRRLEARKREGADVIDDRLGMANNFPIWSNRYQRRQRSLCRFEIATQQVSECEQT
jgi:hypothetical protein